MELVPKVRRKNLECYKTQSLQVTLSITLQIIVQIIPFVNTFDWIAFVRTL